MLLNPLSLMGSSYADNSLTWSAQRTLNWLPETAEVEGTRTPIKFAQPPGLRVLVDLGTGAPIRGLHNVEGKLFAVSGTDLFEISTAFAATDRGNIPGVSRVSMAHNKQGGATAANELAIGNGLSGYVYNTATATLAQITDDAFQGATTFDYVDGFITFTDPQGRWWGHSALNQATSYSSIDRYDAESAPDPIISHIVSHREVMVFGTRTTEFFRNTGAATGTFQRVDGTELEVGICAPFARSRIDNSVCWVSDSLEVFRLEGHAPQRISTRPIEQMLSSVNPANIFAFAWEDRGHKVFYVTAPEAFTLGFDFASGMWHERQTFDLPRWRINDAVAWNGLWVVGDYTNGILYALDWDTYHENGLPLIRERASGYTHGGQNKVLAPYVELLFDTGTPDPEFSQPVIVGDVLGGFVGDPSSGTYTVSGGTPPYGPVTVLSGTFPPGLTLNTDGTWEGFFTTAGSYSWTVGGTDAMGMPFSTPDTAVVENVIWFSSSQTGIVKSPDGFDWLAAPAIDPGKSIFSGGGKVVNVRFAAGISDGETSSDEGATWPIHTGLSGESCNQGTFTGTHYLICGNNRTINRSADGLAYTTVLVGTGVLNSNLVAIASAGGTVLVGGSQDLNNHNVATSLDHGSTWGAGSMAFTGSPSRDVFDLASDGDRFVAVGSGNRMAYTDNAGGAWTQIVTPFVGTGTVLVVAWGTVNGSGRWVASNATGEIAYSADGEDWTLSLDTLGSTPTNADCGGNRFILVGGGVMKHSTDGGVTWTALPNNQTGNVTGVTPLRP